MSKESHFVFHKITFSHQELPRILALSIGLPTPEKIQNVLSLYEGPKHYLVGYFEADTLIGVVGLKKSGVKGIIKHIAVLPKYRLQGLGKALLQYVINHFPLKIIQAETDNEAIDFYKKFGFICQPLQGQYDKRYICEYKL